MDIHTSLSFLQALGAEPYHRIECAGRSDLVERFNHGVLVRCVDSAGAVALAEPEDRLDDRELRGSGVETYMRS